MIHNGWIDLAVIVVMVIVARRVVMRKTDYSRYRFRMHAPGRFFSLRPIELWRCCSKCGKPLTAATPDHLQSALERTLDPTLCPPCAILYLRSKGYPVSSLPATGTSRA